MSPLTYLAACLAVTLVAVVIDAAGDARRRAALRRLAAAHGMHFAPGDRFNLAARVAATFPVVGAACPKVSDVIYGRRDDRYYYAFRFDYTVGVTHRPARRRAIVGFAEPRQATGGHDPAPDASPPRSSPLMVADPAGRPVVEQYRQAIADLLPAAPSDMQEPVTLIAVARGGDSPPGSRT